MRSHHFHPHAPEPVTFLLLSYCRYCKHISLILMTGMLLLFASPASSYGYKFLQIFYLREIRKFYIPLHPAESYPEDLRCTPQKYCIIPSKLSLLPHSLLQSHKQEWQQYSLSALTDFADDKNIWRYFHKLSDHPESPLLPFQ